MNFENLVALTLAISYILGPLVTLRSASLQAHNQEKDSYAKRLEESSAMEKFANSWEDLLNAQREENKRVKDSCHEEIERMQKRFDEREEELQKKFDEREQELLEVIEALKIRVSNVEAENLQLKNELKQVKKTTGQLVLRDKEKNE